jgi:hypothetical protein
MKTLYPICEDGLWGYINYGGSKAIVNRFLFARPFRDGLAQVVLNHDKNIHGAAAFINTDGEVKIGPGPPKIGYERYGIWSEHFEHGALPEWGYRDFSSGRALFRDWSMHRGVGYIDDFGRLVAMGFNDGSDFVDGRAIVNIRKGRRNVPTFIDKDGNVLGDVEADWCGYLSEGRAVYSKDVNGRQLLGYVNTRGHIEIEAQYRGASAYSSGLARVVTDSGTGFIDVEGHYVVSPELREATEFSAGVALVVEDDRTYLIDQRGGFVCGVNLDASDIWTAECSEGMFLVGGVVDGDERQGFVRADGVLICPFQCDLANPFDNGLALVSRNGRAQYLNTHGEVVWETDDWKI